MEKIRLSTLMNKENVVIHTPKKEQCVSLIQNLYDASFSLRSIKGDFWEEYKSETCCSLYRDRLCYDTVKYHTKAGRKIIEFEDVEFDKQEYNSPFAKASALESFQKELNNIEELYVEGLINECCSKLDNLRWQILKDRDERREGPSYGKNIVKSW